MAATYVEDAVRRRGIELEESPEALEAWRTYNAPVMLFLHQIALIARVLIFFNYEIQNLVVTYYF